MDKNIDSLLSEIDALRIESSYRVQLTDEQKRILVHAREGEIPLGWEKLAAWWRQHYETPKNFKTLQAKYREMVASGEIEKYRTGP